MSKSSSLWIFEAYLLLLLLLAPSILQFFLSRVLETSAKSHGLWQEKVRLFLGS